MTALAPQRRGRRRRWFALAAVVLGLTLGFALGEVSVRWFVPAVDDLVFINKDTEAWDCYCSNPRGYFKERQSRDGRRIFCVDHDGEARRDVDWTQPEFAGQPVILTVGDSFTWGLGVRSDDSYPHRLGAILRERFGAPVVVSNHAKVGRMIGEIHAEMRHALTKSVPNICIYGFVLNDPLDGRPKPPPLARPRKKAIGMDNADVDDFINIRTANLEQLRLESFLMPARRVSHLVDLGLRGFEARAIHQRTLRFYRELHDPAHNGEGLVVTWNLIAEMARWQHQAGKHFLVAIFPLFVDLESNYPFADIHERTTVTLESLGVPCLDLLPTFRGRRSAEFWVHPLDRHPNEMAHAMTADALAREIARRGWLSRSPRTLENAP